MAALAGDSIPVGAAKQRLCRRPERCRAGSSIESGRDPLSAGRRAGPLMDRDSHRPKSYAGHHSLRPVKGFFPGGCRPVRQQLKCGPPCSLDLRVSDEGLPDSFRLKDTWMSRTVRALLDRERADQATAAPPEVETADAFRGSCGRLVVKRGCAHDHTRRSRAHPAAASAATMIIHRAEGSPEAGSFPAFVHRTGKSARRITQPASRGLGFIEIKRTTTLNARAGSQP